MREENKKLFITGASGFIGSWLVDLALAQGYNVFAGIRRSSSRTYLQDHRLHFIEMDLDKPQALDRELERVASIYGSFDFVIHNAGVTRANTAATYTRGNAEFVESFTGSLQRHHQELKKFVFISSIAASGPGCNKTFRKIGVSDKANPLTPYGRSKLLAEDIIRAQGSLPHLIFRPGIVFGRRNKTRLWMFKMVRSGYDIKVSFSKQQMAFIWIRDFASLVLQGLISPVINRTYFAADGNPLSLNDFQYGIGQVMNVRTRSLPLPALALHLVDFWDSSIGTLVPKISLVPPKVMREITALNWNVDIDPLKEDFGFQPTPFANAIFETIEGYEKDGWLKARL